MTRRRKSANTKRNLILSLALVIIVLGGLLYTGTIKVQIDASSAQSQLSTNYKIVDSTLDDNFKSKTVLFFTSSWCGSCSRISSNLKSIAANYKNIQFDEVDIEDNRDLSNKYQAFLTPAVVLIDPKSTPKVYQELSNDDLDKIIVRFSLQ